jgi:hypothetical protein
MTDDAMRAQHGTPVPFWERIATRACQYCGRG